MSSPTAMTAELAARLPDERICRDFAVQKLAVFGSVMTPEFDPARSDVDVLVEFAPGTDLGPWLSRLTRLKVALQAVLRRSVDVATSAALRDPRFRAMAEKTLTPLFDARKVPQTVG
jgi:predicted nucleotidyltransferase